MKRSEIPAYIASKPLAKMRRVATALGWNGLQMDWLYGITNDDEQPSENTPIVVYYMTTDLKFNLQINETPIEQSKSYQATVKADRYGIVHTEWVQFELPEDRELTSDELDRLRPLLQRSNYKDRKWVRKIKQTDQVRLLPSRKKRRGKLK